MLTVVMLVAAPGRASAQGPVAAYGFGEGAGTAVADASGSGNHGTASGTTWAAMGRYGTALSFGGSSGWVTVPDSASLDLTTGMTLEAWVNPVQVSGGWRTVLLKQNTNGIAYSLFAANGGARPAGQVFIGGEQTAAGASSLPLDAWSHLATTYDGTTLRLYVNGAEVASKAQTGSATVTSGVLRIGGNSIWGEYFRGLIDEVRIYDRALAPAEIQSDMNTPVAPPVADAQPPTTPAGLTQTGATDTTATIAWNASADNVAVAGYGLYRAGSPAGSTTATSTTLTGLACGTSLLVGVDAYDAPGNRSAQATTTVGTTACDTSPPTVSLTGPPAGPVSGTVTVAATASDDRGVAGVRFRLDGNALGSEDASAPYSVSWDTATASAGTHTLTAVARDAAGNTTTSAPVSVTITDSTPSFVNDRVVIGLDEPTNVAFAPDGRMLVAERDGTVWIVQPGADEVDPAPLLQLPSVATDNERGLLGIALDPGFATNGYFYLYFTHGSQLRNRVSRFQATGGIASTASELVIWQNPFAAAVWHQGGDIHFGPDGYLYIAVGDHLNSQTAQSLTSFNGKILRIAADGTVPADNPFYDGAGPNADAIWVRGLRNPFRFSIDAPTGRMMIGDVGEGTTEEVNAGVRGANYGWPQCEGPCGTSGMTNPVHSYSHNGRDASVTGGFIYRGTQFPAEYQGSYFFADYAMNWIRRLTLDAAGNVTGVRNFEPPNGALDGPYGDIVGLAEGPDGSLWYVDAGPFQRSNAGSLRRIKNVNANQPPTARAAASPASGPAPLTVSFSSAGSADPEGRPITYRWSFGDGDTSTQPNPTHTYGDNGRFTVRLTTSDGANETISAPLTITAGSAPTAEIVAPTAAHTFRAGDLLAFWGQASDPDDGALTGASLSWKVVFHHDDHIHPVLDEATGSSGTLTIPASGHSFQGETSYEIVLTATDADGIQATDSVVVEPDKAPVRLATAPAGLRLDLDGVSRTAPVAHEEIVGFRYTVEAPSPQTAGADRHVFGAWSDGGARSHAVTVPAGGLDLTATFTRDTSAPAGLVAAYSFDEGSGTTLNDRTGRGHAGTLSGATWSAAGRTGGALSFDGVNDSVRVDDAATLDLTTGMTLEAWLRPAALGASWRTVVFKEQPGHMTYALYASTDSGRPTGQAHVGGQRDARGPNALATAAWTHLATTFDGATLRLFVNGLEVRSFAAAGAMAVSTGPLKLGGNAIWDEWYSGLMDDVRVYDRGLSAAEIQGDMATPVSG